MPHNTYLNAGKGDKGQPTQGELHGGGSRGGTEGQDMPECVEMREELLSSSELWPKCKEI